MSSNVDEYVNKHRLIDAIKRQKFWSVLDHKGCHIGVGVKWRDITFAIENMWSLELIRCKDCARYYGTENLGQCGFFDGKFVNGDGFCYWAKRKEK